MENDQNKLKQESEYINNKANDELITQYEEKIQELKEKNRNLSE